MVVANLVNLLGPQVSEVAVAQRGTACAGWEGVLHVRSRFMTVMRRRATASQGLVAQYTYACE